MLRINYKAPLFHIPFYKQTGTAQSLRYKVTKVKKPIFDVDYSDFFHVKDNFEFYFKDE